MHTLQQMDIQVIVYSYEVDGEPYYGTYHMYGNQDNYKPLWLIERCKFDLANDRATNFAIENILK